MSYAEIHPDYPGPVIPESKRNNVVRPQSIGSAHEWICVATYGVSQNQADVAVAQWAAGGAPQGIHLDHENLTNLSGPWCLKCNQPLNPVTHATSCPVIVIPILGG